MKKLLTLLVAGLMTVSMTACGSSSSSNEDRTLIIGSEKFSQAFLNSEALGNSAYDKNVRDVLYGYQTYYLDSNGEFQLDETAIKEVKTEEDKETKNKTFTFTLNDIKFSDGSTITADDYVFHILLAASPEFAEEGEDTTASFLYGYNDYHDGKSETFAGVKKIDDKTFSLTIDGAMLPYFWERSLVAVKPDSMKAIAGEDAKIESSDAGAKFAGDMGATVTNWIGDAMKKPSVTSGPYKFVSYENGQVKLELNENYSGDPQGNKPQIKNIVLKEVSSDVDMDTLVKGEIDILIEQIEGDKIEKGLGTDTLQEAHYDRNGFGNLPFACDFGATKEAEVRRAINFIIDKDQLVKTITGGYGVTLNSDYSTAQWMYTKSKSTLEKEMTYNYAFSLEKANAELDKSSYRFEKDGTTPFNTEKAGEDYLRYNSNGEVLQINHLGTEKNSVTDNLELLLTQNAPKVGIKFTVTKSDFTAILDNFYYGWKKSESERIYNTYNMGSNFSDAPDPYFSSYASEYANSPSNGYGIQDAHLDELMQDLRHTNPDDKDGFLTKWIAYEKYYNEVLPQAPLYANTYYSFANAELDGFKPNSFQTVYQTICTLSWK